jgi:cytochrome oxidase Cu insertion factor (SCO1/SenC/PrrC family)
MKAKRVLAGVLAMWVVGACNQQSTKSQNEGASVGEPAPAFELPSATGARVSLSDFKGKDVLLYFSMGPG